LGNTLVPVIEALSSGDAIGLLVFAAIVLLCVVVFLNICAKFFHYLHDIFTRNAIKFYRFIIVIAIVFVLMSLAGIACLLLIFYKDFVSGFVSQFERLSTFVYYFLPDKWNVISGCIAVNTVIAIISAVMIFGYIRNYKKLFVSQSV